MADDTTPAKPAKADKPALPSGFVNARCLPMGDGLIDTGSIEPGAERYFAKGDIMQLPADVAEALEIRGFAEIQA